MLPLWARVDLGAMVLQLVHKHKQIRLLTPLQTQHPATTGNDEALYDPDQLLQLRKGNKLHLTTFTEHICQK